MFPNQASLETTTDKSSFLLLFSHHLSWGPLSFSSPLPLFYSTLISHHPFAMTLPFSAFLSLFQHCSTPHQPPQFPPHPFFLLFLIWRPLLSLIPHQCYSKDVCININRWDFFFLLLLPFHSFAAHFSPHPNIPYFFFFMLHTFQFQHTF